MRLAVIRQGRETLCLSCRLCLASPLQDDTALKTVGEVFQNCVRTLEAEGWVCMSYVCKECPGMESHLRYLLKDIGEPVAGDTASKPHHHGDELDNAGAKKSHAQHHEPCCDDKTEYEKQLDWILAMQSLAMFQEYSPPVHTTEPAAIMNQHMTAMDVQQTTQLTPEDEYAMSCFLLHQPNDACQQLPAIDFMCQAVQIEADFRPFILSNEEPMFAGM